MNNRARTTCEAWNAKFSNKLHASRRELFASEAAHLKPLPLHVPEVYQLHTRIVDAEGYVHLNRIRCSAPYRLIGRSLEVRETLERVDLYQGARKIASHTRLCRPLDARVTDAAHRPPRGQGRECASQPAPEQVQMLTIEPRLTAYLSGLKSQIGERRAPLRRLLSMLQEYPRTAFLSALATAEQYRLFDLDRLERMVLKRIAEEYFVTPVEPVPSEPLDE